MSITTDVALEQDRVTFADAACVLAVRGELDELAAAVLASEGLGQAPVGRLRQLVCSDRYERACLAWARLEELR